MNRMRAVTFPFLLCKTPSFFFSAKPLTFPSLQNLFLFLLCKTSYFSFSAKPLSFPSAKPLTFPSLRVLLGIGPRIQIWSISDSGYSLFSKKAKPLFPNVSPPLFPSFDKKKHLSPLIQICDDAKFPLLGRPSSSPSPLLRHQQQVAAAAASHNDNSHRSLQKPAIQQQQRPVLPQ